MISRYFMILALIALATTGFAQSMDLTLEHDEIEREYVLHVPAIYDAEADPVPLIIALHGLTNSGQILKETSKFDIIADTANFIVAFPTAITNGAGATAWNNGLFVGSGADDVSFLIALMDTISENYNIDQSRIYFTGFSMGGFMSNRMACEVSHRIAAIASVSGTISYNILPECNPGRPFPMMHMHGTGDFVVSYDGNFLGGFESAETLINYWTGNNACGDTSIVINIPDIADDGITIEKREYQNCADDTEVWFYTAEDQGHFWLQPENDLFASDHIWRFFQRHQLPVDPPVGTEIILAASNLTVYPNPANQFVQIKTEKPDHIQLFDAYGNLIEERTNTADWKADISMLAKGMYIVRTRQAGYQLFIKN